MKKLMCFVGVCALCATMATACTNNGQEATNLTEESNANREKRTGVEVDGEYLVIDRKVFTDVFNTMIENSEVLSDIGKIKKWDKTSLEEDEIETYETSISNSSIGLAKLKKSENFPYIFIYTIYSSEEDYNKAFTMMYMVAMMCENFDDLESEKFKNSMLEVFDDVINIKEKRCGYILGKKCIYTIFYDDSYEFVDNTIDFYVAPATEEEISETIELCSSENDEEPEKEANEDETMVNEELQNDTSEQDTQEQKIISATKKVFGEENYINVFYEPEDNFVLIKAKGKDLLSSSMTAKGMLKAIKDTLYEIREIPDLNVDFNIVYTMVNSAGDTSDDIVVKATYKNETRSSINWDVYVMHENMPNIADEWWVHPAIQTALEE